MNPENLFDIDVTQLIKQLSTLAKSGQGYGAEYKPVFKQTIQLLKRVKSKKANSHTYFSLGECFIKLEDTNYAEKAFHTAWAIEPTNVQAATYLALILQNNRKIDQAIQTYLTINKIDPGNEEIVNQIFELAHQKNDTGLIFQLADQLLAINSKYHAPYHFKSKYYFAAGNLKNAYENATTAFQLKPENFEYHEYYLYFAYLNEDYATVLANENILLDGKFRMALQLMIPNSYAATGEFENARKTFLRLFKSSDNPAHRIEVLVELALFHATHERKVAKANRLNRWIVRRDPENAIAWSNLANNTPNYQLKLDYFRKAHELEPNNHALAMNYGNTLMNLGHLEEGFELYDQRRFLLNKSIANTIKYCDNLIDKKVFIWKEQGLGDIYIWSWLIKRLAEDASVVKVQCETRTKSLLQRSFPTVEFVDKDLHQIASSETLEAFDANMLLITLAKYYFRDIQQLQLQQRTLAPVLKADPDLVTHYKNQLSAMSSLPVVGICWRSSVNDYKRDNYYLNYFDVETIFNDLPCSVLNLQYLSTEEETTYLSDKLGDRFIQFDEVDLKDDQDAIAAMIMACDFVVSVPTAVMALTGALGKKLLSTAGSGFLGKPGHPFFKDINSIAETGKADQDILHFRQAISDELSHL